MTRAIRLGLCSATTACLALAASACEPLPARTTAARAPALEMPWPPPTPSTSIEIPAELRPPVGPGAHMNVAAEWLTRALADAGYQELSWYDVPGGFEVRTHAELVDDQGLGLTPPDPAQRFAPQLPQTRFFTTSFWSELLVHHVGRFRCFVFLVVDAPLTYTKDVTDGMLAWRPPARALPLSRVDFPLDGHARWYALVYEFEHPKGEPSARLAQEPTDPAVHLEKSGVLPALRKLAKAG